MTKQEVQKLVAMYLIAVGHSGSPSSHVWMAVDKNMEDVYQHEAIVAGLVQLGVFNMSNHFITLTPKGQAMHDKVAAILVSDVTEALKNKEQEGAS